MKKLLVLCIAILALSAWTVPTFAAEAGQTVKSGVDAKEQKEKKQEEKEIKKKEREAKKKAAQEEKEAKRKTKQAKKAVKSIRKVSK